MFIIFSIDKDGYIHRSNDINTAADIFYGLTGDYEDYKRGAAIMGNMKIGDRFISKGYFIACDKEE